MARRTRTTARTARTAAAFTMRPASKRRAERISAAKTDRVAQAGWLDRPAGLDGSARLRRTAWSAGLDLGLGGHAGLGGHVGIVTFPVFSVLSQVMSARRASLT